MLDEIKISELVEKYDAEAEKNFRNYQETGISRYERAQHKAEDLADALRAALEAVPTRQKLSHFKAVISYIAGKAESATEPSEYEAVVKELLSFARMEKLIGGEQNDK